MSHQKYTYESLLDHADINGIDAAINLIACELGSLGFHYIGQLIYKREYGTYVELVNLLQYTFVHEDTPNDVRIYGDRLVDCFIRIHVLSTMGLLLSNFK